MLLLFFARHFRDRRARYFRKVSSLIFRGSHPERTSQILADASAAPPPSRSNPRSRKAKPSSK
jgi:hypothetical protein